MVFALVASKTYESREWKDGTTVSFDIDQVGKDTALEAAMLRLSQEEDDHI